MDYVTQIYHNSGTKNNTITLIANIQQALKHCFVDLVRQRKQSSTFSKISMILKMSILMGLC